MLHSITSVGTYSLRIDLEDFDNEKRYAVYDQFAVDSEKNGFRLTVGGYSGNAGKIIRHSLVSTVSTLYRPHETRIMNIPR